MRFTSVPGFFAAILLAGCGPATASTTLMPAASPTQAQLLRVDWPAYHDPSGFVIQHPLTWQQVDNGGYPVVFALQAAPGTSLIEKRMEIDVTESTGECKQSTYGTGVVAPDPEHVKINGIDFLREVGGGVAAGNVYESTSYSTLRGAICIGITFVLHSSSSGVYATEPPPFDREAESATFDELLSTFQFDP